VIWALLALLGVPIWLVVGGLAVALWSRRRFRAQPGVFRIAVRSAGDDSWPRVASYGRLIRDVLVVNRGLALVRTEFFPILDVCGLDGPLPPKMDGGATARLLRIDGHEDLEVGVPVAVGRQLDRLTITRDG
jgi:hypothetical protein